MPRTCTICGHADREAIDRALVDGAAFRHIASRYGMSTGALQRHKAEHLPAAMVKGKEAKEEAHALDVVRQLRAINGAALAILKESRDNKDNETALKAIDRVQRQIELQAKLLGELKDGPTINLVVAPQWLEIRAVILQALKAHPEAGQAVVAALASVEGHARN